MTDSRTPPRGVFVMLCLCALASARCADREAAQPGPGGEDGGSDGSGLGNGDGGDGPTCSFDVQADPKNCGRCGHDCLGGGCAEGTCMPVVLASDQLVPTEIVLDATHVYFTNAGSSGILRVPKVGGDVETLIDQLSNTSSIVVDDTNVFFVNGPYVQAIPKAGLPDGGLPSTLATLSNAMPVIAGDATQVFITTGKVTGAVVSPGFLYAVPKGGGTVKYNVSTGTPTTSMAVDGVNVCFTTATSVVGPSRLLCVPKSSAASGNIVWIGGDPQGLFADGTDLYWANASNGSIKTVPTPSGDGGTPREVASGQAQPARIARDDAALYWSSKGNGAIASCPLSGCASSGARVVQANQAAPVGIAVDDVAIYWANSGSGTVMKVAK